MLVPHDFLNLIRVSRVSSGPPVLLSFVSDPGGYDEDVAIELLQDAADTGHGAATEALEQLQEDTEAFVQFWQKTNRQTSIHGRC